MSDSCGESLRIVRKRRGREREREGVQDYLEATKIAATAQANS